MRVPASAAAERAAVPPTLQLVRENRLAGAGAPPLITVVVCVWQRGTRALSRRLRPTALREGTD